MKEPIDWNKVKERVAATGARLTHGWEGDAAKIARIQTDRATKLAGRAGARSEDIDCFTALVFGLGQEKFALALASVQEVIPLASFTPIPGAPDEYLGLFNFRGRVAPLFRLERLLGAESMESVETSRLKFAIALRSLDAQGAPVAIAVESILATSELSAPSEDAPGERPFGKFAKFMSPERIVVLDPGALFNHPLIHGEAGPAGSPDH